MKTDRRRVWIAGLALLTLASPLLAQQPGVRCVTSPYQVGDYTIDFWEDFSSGIYDPGAFPEAEWTLYQKTFGGVLSAHLPVVQSPTFLDLDLGPSSGMHPISAILSKRGVNGGGSGSLVEVSYPPSGNIGPSGREERGRWQAIAHIVPRVDNPAAGDHFGLFLRVTDIQNPSDDRDLSRFGVAVQKAGSVDSPCKDFDAFLQFQRAGYVPGGGGR
ncbi:MAG: hypothetical protein MI919_07955, partial [Holophagales bacterium]|nr:hypothetical protein [Holophagales bacterium]